MKNEIFLWRGVEGLVASEILKDDNETDGGYEAGEVFKVAGVGEIGKTTETSTETKYYDNVPAMVITSTGADEITCTVSGIPLNIVAKLTGQFYDELTGTLIEGARETRYFALGYKTKKSNGNEVFVWRLKGTFNIPDTTNKTEDDGTDAEGQELVYTGIMTTHKFTKVVDKNGNKKGAKGINVDLEEGLADVTGFFDKVQTPDTLKAKTEPTPPETPAE